jgi:hypothetical protein
LKKLETYLGRAIHNDIRAKKRQQSIAAGRFMDCSARAAVLTTASLRGSDEENRSDNKAIQA